MRERKARIKDAVGETLRARGGSFRTLHDADGDSGVALVMFMREPGIAKRLAESLAADNVPATRLYNDGELLPRDYVDLHAYEAGAAAREAHLVARTAGRGEGIRARSTTRRTPARARWTSCAGPCTST